MIKDHPCVVKYANSFAATTGLDREDLLQEARLALHRAEVSPSYDPHLAAFNTYATWSVYRALCSYAHKHASAIVEVELDDELPSREPDAEHRVLLGELIRGLPEDARAVVALVTGDALAVAGLSPRDAKRHVRLALGLSRERADAAFDAIRHILTLPPGLYRSRA